MADQPDKLTAAQVREAGLADWRISDHAAPSYWVVEDAEGNRSCICTPHGR